LLLLVMIFLLLSDLLPLVGWMIIQQLPKCHFGDLAKPGVTTEKLAG